MESKDDLKDKEKNDGEEIIDEADLPASVIRPALYDKDYDEDNRKTNLTTS